jgi:membrane-associated phospholipid phosphatase
LESVSISRPESYPERVIVFSPGAPLWDLAQHVPWLRAVVVALTIICAVATPIAIFPVWFRTQGFRCVLSILVGLVSVQLIRIGSVHLLFVSRPFVVHHFKPLYPHSRDSSFPSSLTAYFAACAMPVWFVWRKLGLLLFVITFEVALGCVYVGVHYVSDVFAGAAIGAGSAGIEWWLFGQRPLAPMIGTIDNWLIRIHLRSIRQWRVS